MSVFVEYAEVEYFCYVLVYPEEADDGLRRSKRTRVNALAWYRNERIMYNKRKSGEHDGRSVAFLTARHCFFVHRSMFLNLKYNVKKGYYI